MYRLLYVSTARAALSDDGLQMLLAESRRRNESVDVSGLLIAGDRRFMQVLEGSEAAVLSTFARIRCDPRHFAMVEIARGSIAARSFARWSMGYARSGGGLFRAGPTATIASLIAPIADPVIKAYFAGFAETDIAA